MTNTPAAVAATYFDALGRGDFPTVMAQFSDAVVWNQPGANQFSGTHHGVDGVGALLGGMMEASQGTFQLAVTGPAMVNGELVAVPVRFTGQRAGTSMDMAGIDLLTVRDGKIIEAHLFSEDGVNEDLFWGQK
ncbi:ketosteroid isomerase [Pseudoclavibacter sp. RFBJ3]|uniref:nuclear transport factor 2 family protein n=1 Tax=unclassified Pseudoclavibacter TaxID=2615177 RepID=UPI000CE880D0|nr:MULTISPECIES: nuclear transport factor 2 family protein [unclassified Pseudoclavibacter]PPF87525.1 ketosteroid isomerase [Pseudoclavibacter sp. RFBJ5]PPF90375.1 ketosteroid isomerase [Pseudoclavibacter sp. RFBJ3]PPG01060.1 ketosteroid isomerase [Pseudoclavibacter sp. RFBH5]PPG26163.1 ketosteroid isomerase [Pseudoclavibacter sp. RFBI4]